MGKKMDISGAERRKFFDYQSLKIRLANQKDAQAVENLRIRAYQRAKNLQLLDPTVMAWNECDDTHLVLVVENEIGDLVSTLRAIKINNQRDFTKWTNIIAPAELHFPLVYFKTGSTDLAYSRLGLNVLLRMESIQYFLTTDIQWVISTINRGTSREQLMKKMGYSFQIPNLRKRNATNSPFIFKTSLIMAMLKKANFSVFLNGIDASQRLAFKRIRKDSATAKRIHTYLTST